MAMLGRMNDCEALHIPAELPVELVKVEVNLVLNCVLLSAKLLEFVVKVRSNNVFMSVFRCCQVNGGLGRVSLEDH